MTRLLLTLTLVALSVWPTVAAAQRRHRVEIEPGSGVSADSSRHIVTLASAQLEARDGIAVGPGDARGATHSRVTWEVDARDEPAGIVVRFSCHVVTDGRAHTATRRSFSIEMPFAQRHSVAEIEPQIARMLTQFVVDLLPAR